jgi:hypothetical protein
MICGRRWPLTQWQRPTFLSEAVEALSRQRDCVAVTTSAPDLEEERERAESLEATSTGVGATTSTPTSCSRRQQ